MSDNNAILENQPVEQKKEVAPAHKEAEIAFKQAMATLEVGEYWLNKNYLTELSEPKKYAVQNIEQNLQSNDMRLFQLNRINLENKQSMLESLTAVYHTLGVQGYTVFLFLDCKNSLTQLYLGVKKSEGKGKEGGDLLEATLNGHFAGSQYTRVEKHSQTLACLSPDFAFHRAITSLTTVPSLALEEREHFMQGLEKFIDAAEQQNYQALFLAEPVAYSSLHIAEKQYANMATQLSPLVKQQVSFGDSSSQSIGESISKSITQSFTQTETTGTNTAIAEGKNITEGESTAEGITNTLGTSESITAGGSVGVPFVASGNVSVTAGVNYSQSRSRTITLNRSITNSLTKTTGESHSSATAKAKGESETESQNTGSSETQSRTISFDTQNKSIEQIVKLIDTHLSRIEEAKSYGGWQTAVYFIADKPSQSQALASIYLGLMRGKDSHSETAAISTWQKEDAKPIFAWLENLTHPRFHSGLYLNEITPATLVSGKEMAVQLGLPRRSTSTVTVVESQSFGRSIQTTDTISGVEKASKSIHLGTIRHLWQDTKQAVDLDVQKLSSHIFVTGSTGSGKSNTVYQILDQLNKNDVKFMVIEPAKGEYKNVFGHRKDVLVLGTNPTQAQLLKINPFKFPKGVHVLEHIDRLVEIFNVCWPMYAAMPAVLKDAMLEAYRASGWNLDSSCNIYSDELFPTFKDLLFQLENVINQSAFSQEVKSNYIGSLVTRVKSLTNGLNGQIFSSAEIDNETLFDQNVIVDLSRIGSQETKSLIMGILVMRLSEYRMSSSGMNQALKHVTVLEEAHNILKRTSTEQSSEGANVAGKAVEMLSNAIAEMRTYGEGFVIADQSPSAVDISAIRNTNTKIVMRLPDEADRRLAGKASGVTDEQLEEIAKLPKGVAVVYQNDWLEPVLCKIHHFNGVEKAYCYTPSNHISLDRKVFNLHLARLLLTKVLPLPEKYDLSLLKQGLEKFDVQTEIKIFIHRIIDEVEKYGSSSLLKIQNYRKIATYLVSALELRSSTYTKLLNLNEINNFESFSQDLSTLLMDKLERFSKDLAKSIEQSIVTAFSLEEPNHEIVLLAWKKIQENIK